MPKKEDLSGKIFNLIKCVSPSESKNGKTYWNCECIICGQTKIIQTTHIKDGRSKTCGCGCQINKQIKQCKICGKDFQIKANGHTRIYCYECSPSYEHGESKSETMIALRKAMKKQAVKMRGGKCERCGYDKCIGALQFHHRNPEEKKFGLSMNGITHSWNEYLLEVEKCDLLCANCHAEAHYNEEVKK